MSYRKTELLNNEVYHIILRGVADSVIFRDVDDYYRGIFSLYEFNNSKPVEIRKRREDRKKEKVSGGKASARDLLVDILAFCFMPNHIHILLKQIKDDGITKFMQKFGTGYTVYSNKKYSNKGHLFQGKFLSVYIKNDIQLKIVFTYIHTNPISLIEPGWKEVGIRDPEKAIKFLEEYKWSSYLDYINKNNFPSVTERKFILEVMSDEKGCKEFIYNWANYKKEFKEYEDSFIGEK